MNNMKPKHLFTLAFCLASTAQGSADVMTFSPLRDATIFEGNPTLNTGSAATITSGRDDFLQQTIPLLDFDLSAIPPGATINSAQLTLFVRSTDSTPATTLTAADVTGAWSETTVNWNTRPALDCCHGSASLGPDTSVEATWDISSLVQTWVMLPGPTRFGGVAITGPASLYERTFDSREGANPPRLVVDFTPPAPDGQLVVTIDEALAREKNTDTVFGNQEDFYVRVSVNGDPVVTSRVIDGRDHPSWTPSITVTANVVKARQVFPVTVELWDADDTSADDQFDLNPASGKTLNLEFDSCLMRWQRVDGTEEYGPGPAWMPREVDLGSLSGDPGQVHVQITTGDGKPFSPDDVAIVNASPVQAVFNPKYLISDKPTSFMLQLASSWSVSRNADISVTFDDGMATVTDSKTVVVPPAGLRVFFFDGSGSAGAFMPKRNDTDHLLHFDVMMDVEGEPPTVPVPPWFNCVGANNVLSGGALKTIVTRNDLVVYRRWDWSDDANPPSVATLQTNFMANETFRQAVFPIPAERGSFALDPAITEFGPATPDILGIIPDFFGFEPAQTIAVQSTAAMLAGIDRLVLMPRNGWFSDNDSRIDFGSGGIGLSLAEFGPHAVIAEAGFSEVAVHELGHTYWQSQHSCSTGGAAEDLLNVGCRDEYLHTAADGRPYLAMGFDVVGNVYPSGVGPVSAGTREVSSTNLMDTTPAAPGAFDRWIDTFTYNDIADRLNQNQDPALLTVTGLIWARKGLASPAPDFAAYLFPAYQFDGTPDLPEAKPGASSGGGLFAIYLATGQGPRIYRFNPRFFTVQGQGDAAFFSFSIPWDAGATALALDVPSNPQDEEQSQDMEIFRIDRTASSPKVSVLQAAIDTAPAQGSPQPEPPTIQAGHDLVVAWQADDSDSKDLRAVLLLQPPFDKDLYNGWLPFGVFLKDNQAVIPYEQLAGRPGQYGARLLVSDGLNSAALDSQFLFDVEMPPALLPAVQMVRQTDSMVLSWPSTASGFQLEETDSLTPPIQWSPVNQPPEDSGGMMTVTVPFTGSGRFFRLHAVQ